MGRLIRNKLELISNMKKTTSTLRWIWIISLFFSPLIGLVSILIISYIGIIYSIEWK